MADHQQHDVLETWQLAVGIATGLIGLLYYARKPAKTAEPAPSTVGPSGLGEVAGGGGGGGGSFAPPEPAKPAGGQQSPPTGPKPLEAPAPGESQHEYERKNQPKTPGLEPVIFQGGQPIGAH